LTKTRKRRKRNAQKSATWHRKRALERYAKGWNSVWCPFCKKIAWPSRDRAESVLDGMKADPRAKRAHLLSTYECPQKLGFHIGHRYPFPWASLCIGEHK